MTFPFESAVIYIIIRLVKIISINNTEYFQQLDYQSHKMYKL